MKSSPMTTQKPMRVALVVPHIFMHEAILPQVIFSPGHLAIALADSLHDTGVDVTLFTPGPVATKAQNTTADLSLFERELEGRGDTYMDLLRKHPFTFISLARQVQSEIIAMAYEAANADQFDIVHIYTNEEEIGYAFASLCQKPVVFTHHDPFNFLVKYKNVMPKYKHLNWLSMSLAQRKGMPESTHWVGNIYHGLSDPVLKPVENPSGDYVAYMGRVIQPKGVHLAIAAVNAYNQTADTPLKLKIAGKHYSEESKDTYWKESVEPYLNDTIEYVGFISSSEQKRTLLGNARALLVPSLFDEPFGMVTLESFACGTPVIALDSGALPEVIEHGKTGFIVKKQLNWNDKFDEHAAVSGLVEALKNVDALDRQDCRKVYEEQFTRETMAREHRAAYETVISNHTRNQ